MFFSGSSAFSKTSLNIWKFTVHVLVKPGLENFEHYFTSVWDECNCAVVWAFFGIAFLWNCNENWPFPVLLVKANNRLDKSKARKRKLQSVFVWFYFYWGYVYNLNLYPSQFFANLSLSSHIFHQCFRSPFSLVNYKKNSFEFLFLFIYDFHYRFWLTIILGV